MDPNHRLYHYREHAAAMVEEGQGQGGSKQRGAPPGVMPSSESLTRFDLMGNNR